MKVRTQETRTPPRKWSRKKESYFLFFLVKFLFSFSLKITFFLGWKRVSFLFFWISFFYKFQPLTYGRTTDKVTCWGYIAHKNKGEKRDSVLHDKSDWNTCVKVMRVDVHFIMSNGGNYVASLSKHTYILVYRKKGSKRSCCLKKRCLASL